MLVSTNKFVSEMSRKSYYTFFLEFWKVISAEKLVLNWHIEYLCNELQQVAERVFAGQKKEYDLIVNCPPGTSKSSIFSVLFQPWVWTRMPSARVITGSFSERLALDLSRKSRDVVMSDKYRGLFPEVELREDQNTKGYFANSKGGIRYAVGVGGSVLGFHAHFILPDDPLDPQGALSDLVAAEANVWMSETLSQRKVDKNLTPTCMVMQRLHQNDPTGNWLERGGSIRHISLPGDLEWEVKPDHLRVNYKDGLFDPNRISRAVLDEAYKTLGEVGYAGQYGQHPVPRGGALFKVDRLMYDPIVPSKWKVEPVRYWDKAISLDKRAAYTTGGKQGLDFNDNVWILDVRRGRWDSATREDMILQTARADGKKVRIGMEQEPASSGKESVENSAMRLSLNGFHVIPDKVTGNKEHRADTFSVAVNAGRVILVPAPWNSVLVEEMRFFPHSRFKDQIDCLSGGYSMVSKKRLRVGRF